jgi:hydrogenase maturation protease
LTEPNESAGTPGHAPAKRTTLILGLGNVLLADEAVGPVAVGRLEAETRPGEPISFLDGGTLGLSLAVPISEHARLIVIDAAVMGDAPGAVRVFEDDAMDLQLSRHASSIHEVSLSDLIDIARLTDSLPARRALIGIEPALVDWGDGLTPAVDAAIEPVLRQVRDLLARWDREDGAGG